MDDVHARFAATRLCVCVGPGGAGKTTVSAALALALGRSGRRVFLLTVDPARRLADALGVSLSDAGAEVPLPRGATGRVFAAMLETQTGWDAAIGRLAPDPVRRQAILDNRVYQAFSRTLARSHAYVAMERLHEALEARDEAGQPRWDLVVLDTPPMMNALEILDAPAVLGRFVEARVVSAWIGRGASWQPGARAARTVLSMVMGAGLAGELAGFLEAFAPLREGFAGRSAAVRAALDAPSTTYVLVTGHAEAQLGDALHLRDELARRGRHVAGLVLNRAMPAPSSLDPVDGWDAGAARAWLATACADEDEADALLALLEARRARVAEERVAVRQAVERFSPPCPWVASRPRVSRGRFTRRPPRQRRRGVCRQGPTENTYTRRTLALSCR